MQGMDTLDEVAGIVLFFQWSPWLFVQGSGLVVDGRCTVCGLEANPSTEDTFGMLHLHILVFNFQKFTTHVETMMLGRLAVELYGTGDSVVNALSER